MKVFLSYSHSDQALASQLAHSLKELGLDVWDMQDEIFPGDNWAEKTSQALQESEAMIVLLSKESLHNMMVRREVEYGIGNKKYRGRLIPVLIDGARLEKNEDFPWILHQMSPVDLTQYSRHEEGFRQIAQSLLSPV